MSFYDDASWLLIPSGIKEDVVFAQKPTSGLGDLTFTRASDATYTDASGVVRRSPYNLLQFSEQFDNAVWLIYTGTTKTANVTTAPDGTLTADKIEGTSAAFRGVRQSVTSQIIPHTFSVYLKSATGSNQNARIWIDTTQLTITLTTEWQRFTITATPTTTTFNVIISSSISGGLDLYTWGAQLVEGTEALDYFPTTNRQDVPRIDFRNADGTLSSCGRLLLEPQRTNSIRNSSMVGAVAGTPGTLPTNWSVGSGGLTRTITAIGTENGLPYIEARFNGTASSSSAQFTFETVTGISASAAQSWTESVYVRYVSGAANSAILAWDEYTSGSVYLTSKASTALTIGSTLSRVSLTATTSTNCAFVQPFIRFALTSGQTYDFTIRIAAPQMELGAYATSWVPTTTAAVTRLADTASKTGVSSLIGQTEGTLFFECEAIRTGISQSFSVSDGTLNNRVDVRLNSSNLFQSVGQFSGVTQFNISGGSFANGQRCKIALSYKADNAILYANGVQIGTDTSVAISGTFNKIALDLGSSTGFFNSPLSQAVIYPMAMTATELAQLTTL